jgi:hypothetical protein
MRVPCKWHRLILLDLLRLNFISFSLWELCMISSGIKQRSKTILSLFIISTIFLFYQNCGEGFEVTENASNAPFEILLSPRNKQAYVGEVVVIETILKTSSDNISYQWFKNGEEILGAIYPTLVLGAKNTPPGVKENDEGSYTLMFNASAVFNKKFAKKLNSVQVFVDPVPDNVILPAAKNLSYSRSVKSGEAFVLSADVSGYPKPSMQWYKNNAAIPNANMDFLKIDSATSVDEGKYYLEVSNAKTVDGVTKGGVGFSDPLLIIIDKKNSAPELIQVTEEQKLPAGAIINLKSNFVGVEPPTYQWYRNGKIITGATHSTLVIPNGASLDHAGEYEIRASNSAGATSGFVDVSIFDGINITTALQNKIVALGAPVSFTVVAQGEVESYKWFKNNIEIPGELTAVLNLGPAELLDNGEYKVEIKNIAGTVQSVATLSVVTRPIILSGLWTQSIDELASTVFSISVAGVGLTYKWFKNNVEIIGLNAAELVIQGATILDAGVYRVEVSNVAGSAYSQSQLFVAFELDASALYKRDCAACHGPYENSTKYNKTAAQIKTAMLTIPEMQNLFLKGALLKRSDAQISALAQVLKVDAPVITVQPESRDVSIGQTIILDAYAEGRLLKYQWFKEVVGGDVMIPSATNNRLVITDAKSSDKGNYYLEVSNPAGKVKSKIASANVTDQPVVFLNPAPLKFLVGQNISFAAEVRGSGLTFQWYKDNAPIPGAATSGLYINNAKESDRGIYYLIATNSAGSARSANALAEIYQPPRILGIVGATLKPNVGPQGTYEIILPIGGNVFLTASASGTDLTYQWFKNGISYRGNTATISINPLKISDAGVYTVQASNKLGAVTFPPVNIEVLK